MKQPLSEAFICLKWQKLNWLFYLTFFYHFTLAIIVTLLAFFEASQHPIFVKWTPITRSSLTWFLLAFYIPALLQLVFSVVQKRMAFFTNSWVYLQRPCISIPLPSLSSVVQCGLLVFITVFLALILTTNEDSSHTLVHISAWTVFLAWISCVLKGQFFSERECHIVSTQLLNCQWNSSDFDTCQMLKYQSSQSYKV